MAKKSDTPGYRASSPASASGHVAERLPYVPGAILERAAAVPSPATATAEPLPAGGWPRVDDYLDARGVRRQIGIFARESEDDLGEPRGDPR